MLLAADHQFHKPKLLSNAGKRRALYRQNACRLVVMKEEPVARNRCLLYTQLRTFSWPSLTSGFDPTRKSADGAVDSISGSNMCYARVAESENPDRFLSSKQTLADASRELLQLLQSFVHVEVNIKN